MDVQAYWQRAAVGARDGSAILAVQPFRSSPTVHGWINRRMLAGTLRLVERARPGRLRRALDLGSGPGWFAAAIAPRCDAVVAVDFAAAFVAQARAQLAALGHPRAHAVVADVRAWDDFDADLVHLGAVGMYLEDDELAALYRRAAGGLPRDGVLVQREWVVTGLGRQGRARRGDYASWQRRARRYRQLAGAAGLVLAARRWGPSLCLEEEARARLGDVVGAALAWPARALGAASLLGRTRSSVTMVYRRA